MNLSGDELDGDEILLVLITGVEKQKAIRLHSFKVEVDVQFAVGGGGGWGRWEV